MLQKSGKGVLYRVSYIGDIFPSRITPVKSLLYSWENTVYSEIQSLQAASILAPRLGRYLEIELDQFASRRWRSLDFSQVEELWNYKNLQS